MTKKKKTLPPPVAPPLPSTGEGADSALEVLRRRRLPQPGAEPRPALPSRKS